MFRFKNKDKKEENKSHIGNVSCSSVDKKHLEDLLFRWDCLIKGIDEKNPQVSAVKACMYDLEIIIKVYCS
jgi:hypothetical protein